MRPRPSGALFFVLFVATENPLHQDSDIGTRRILNSPRGSNRSSRFALKPRPVTSRRSRSGTTARPIWEAAHAIAVELRERPAS
jgi:hypothetical protein